MSLWDDYKYDYDYDPSDRDAEPTCRRCGSTDVRWRMQTGKWTLFSLQPGVLHQCEIKADDFDVIPE